MVSARRRDHRVVPAENATEGVIILETSFRMINPPSQSSWASPCRRLPCRRTITLVLHHASKRERQRQTEVVSNGRGQQRDRRQRARGTERQRGRGTERLNVRSIDHKWEGGRGVRERGGPREGSGSKLTSRHAFNATKRPKIAFGAAWAQFSGNGGNSSTATMCATVFMGST